MRINITGHSNGIGLAIAKKFEGEGFLVGGFSRSTGYDIGKLDDRLKIIEQSKDADIFVNNAYDPIGQIDLLEKINRLYAGTDKLIINVSSKLSFFPLGSGYDQYIIAKQNQNQFVRDRIFKSNPRILNIITGLVDTDMGKVFESKKINPKDFADLLFDIIKYQRLISIQEIVIDADGLDWKTIKRK